MNRNFCRAESLFQRDGLTVTKIIASFKKKKIRQVIYETDLKLIPNYLLQRELFFEEPFLPSFEERPLELLVLELLPLPVVFFDEELLLPLSLRGEPEDFGCPLL